jgi:hypothetical protein
MPLGQSWLTSAVGPTDVSVHRSMVRGGQRSVGPLVSLTTRLTGGAVGPDHVKEKEKRGTAWVLGLKVLGQLGLAQYG